MNARGGKRRRWAKPDPAMDGISSSFDVHACHSGGCPAPRLGNAGRHPRGTGARRACPSRRASHDDPGLHRRLSGQAAAGRDRARHHHGRNHPAGCRHRLVFWRDSTQLATSLDTGPDIRPRATMTDKGYGSKANRAVCRERGIAPVIPPSQCPGTGQRASPKRSTKAAPASSRRWASSSASSAWRPMRGNRRKLRSTPWHPPARHPGPPRAAQHPRTPSRNSIRPPASPPQRRSTA